MRYYRSIYLKKMQYLNVNIIQLYSITVGSTCTVTFFQISLNNTTRKKNVSNSNVCKL